MRPDTSHWRSSSAYDYVDHLTAPDVGWEWLRRNADYQRSFAELSLRAPGDVTMIEEVARHWGVRFPC